MERRTKILIGAGAVVACGWRWPPASRWPSRSGGDDNEPPITGDALEQASAAALEHTGGGEVTETEVGDEESYYEVEVTLDDGTQVDVQLDDEFNVVGDETDGAGEDEGAGDDD